jgi:hypothetical protein
MSCDQPPIITTPTQYHHNYRLRQGGRSDWNEVVTATGTKSFGYEVTGYRFSHKVKVCGFPGA